MYTSSRPNVKTNEVLETLAVTCDSLTLSVCADAGRDVRDHCTHENVHDITTFLKFSVFLNLPLVGLSKSTISRPV